MSFTHIDCFCGPGGLCTGLHAAGFDTLVAIDSIKSCVDTYAANHPGVHMIHGDIRDVAEKDPRQPAVFNTPRGYRAPARLV